MGLPSVNIVFQSKAIKAIERGTIGTLALVLKDASVTELTEYIMSDIADIPDTLSTTNQTYLEQAFWGTPKEVKAIVIPDTATDYSEALNYLETIKFNILAIPGIADTDTSTVASWVKSMRDTKERKIIAVLPDEAADHEGIVNFCVEDGTGVAGVVTVGSDTYSASEYSARIAGLISGLPLTIAPTYQVLSEVTDVPHLTKSEADTEIDAGKLILYHDGEKVKIARGVTSLVTTTETKGEDWKKIKLVRILDMIYTDIKTTIEDEYIGKVQNSYENKLLLCAAINAYFEVLEQERVLDPGKNKCEIDIEAQKAYLRSIGEDVDNRTTQQIKEANTRDKVFLLATVRPLDAIEDVQLVVNL
ncbi:phage tail sheath subtilisin-like domain-containing protein [Thermosyntropha sp.]|uniref:phage tail sheath subtilisin-like domain-containing protein n=1 Tax=Thermosyntropha sp. TaxID=2740820 RepID=UPI0025CF340C|nr:phage tail sheath subtilisin-like domain-containing protein [Thermosyntropha sp.]MBO8158829.1 phage tail sheath subtilisin-like domain-containing protein [Thermosyntropha sp.]